MKIGVIDYGIGNLGSMLGALGALNVLPVVLSNPVEIQAVDRLILPGVGNFSDCKKMLDAGGWSSALREQVLGYRRPMLGVCIGMQLLADSSTEGAIDNQSTEGLGFIPGKVRHLSSFGCTLRIPHIGWNSISRTSIEDQMLNSVPDGTDFYFVHSYAFEPLNDVDKVAITNYGVPIAAAVRRGHIWGTQFHPEKSSKAGFKVLHNFIEGNWC
jgi:imidazole glycerol-phosphate synthase subunit HisH